MFAGVVILAGGAACGMGDPAQPSQEPFVAPVATSVMSNDVGTVTLHRLNGAELDNTVRDLVGATAARPSASFPPDDGAGSFTNNADALTISPLLFEKYATVVEDIANAAASSPKIVKCDPAAETACATETLSRFAKRAWRRTPAAADIARLVAVFDGARKEGLAFRDALAVAIEATLLSPRFWFRIETDPDPGSPTPHPLDDFELASRLSYFLFASMPDDVLFAYAEAGKLHEPRVFDQQIERMLRDAKAQSLVEQFGAQWLLHNLAEAAPDPTAFPEWSEELRVSMTGETKAFIGSFLLGDRSLVAMMSANYTFLDARMAAHYGVAKPGGEGFVQTTLAPTTHRGGLLTQASFLTMTSVATRTSPVRRGEWVLSELLCAPPPPPPPGVPALDGNVKTGTMRQRMEEHRKNPVCATCHTMMDPIGFALERYDGLGRWRDNDDGVAIDTTGKLPGGATIDGEVDLAREIENDPRFAQCATRKLYAYALGRAPRSYDEGRLAELTQSFVASDHRFRELVIDIVHSDAFRMRRGGE
jgi:hypothetical protein